MRAFITGINGFCGRHLARLLRGQAVEVSGIEQASPPRTADRRPLESAAVEFGDIRDEDFVADALRKFEPDQVFHLAALTTEPETWEGVKALYGTNLFGTLNLLEAASQLGHVTVIVPSSSAIYDFHSAGDRPAAENAPLYPESHYGLTKLIQDVLGNLYARRRGLNVVTLRCFNLIGPGQSDQAVSSSLARQIALAESGRARPIVEVGNLEVRRDYVDARDAVRAFWLAAGHAPPGGVYNMCSGRQWSVSQLLDTLIDSSTLARSQFEIKPTPSRLRPNETLSQVGDSTKLRQATGWQPVIAMEQTLKDILDYWRETIRAT